MFEQDYIMRLIKEMVRTIVKLLFHIDMEKQEVFILQNIQDKDRYEELIHLIEKGRINEAENKLLEELNAEDMEDYKVALMFYSYLNEKDNDFLEEHDFSREEVMDGLRHVSRVYGQDAIVEAMFKV